MNTIENVLAWYRDCEADEQRLYHQWATLKDLHEDLKAIQNTGGELSDYWRGEILREIEAIREILDT